jgi:hypothetical protein
MAPCALLGVAVAIAMAAITKSLIVKVGEGPDQLVGIVTSVREVWFFFKLIAAAKIDNRLASGELAEETNWAAARVDTAVRERKNGGIKSRKISL